MADERAQIVEELIKQRKLYELRDYIKSLCLDELKFLLGSISPESRNVVFRLLPKDMASQLFESLSEDIKSNMISKMRETAKIFQEIDVADLTEILDELPPSIAVEILRAIPKEERIEILKMLGYEEGMAGRLINPEFIKASKKDSVSSVLKKIRLAKNIENIEYIYIVDEVDHLLGVVELRKLLHADPRSKISHLMKEFPYVFATEDREEVVRKTLESEISEIPIVDSEQKLIGIVPSEDAMEVLSEEASEDIEKLGAVSKTDEQSYFYSNLKEKIISRLPWLVVLLLAAFSSASIISLYQDHLENVIILAAFIPMILGTGGNTASQVISLVVRGIATGEINSANALKILIEEFKTIILLALALGVIGFFISFIEAKASIISFIVAISILCIVIAANLVSFILPFLLKKMGIDPAVASGPLVTTLLDSLGLLIFFNTAGILLAFFKP